MVNRATDRDRIPVIVKSFFVAIFVVILVESPIERPTTITITITTTITTTISYSGYLPINTSSIQHLASGAWPLT